MWLLVFRHGAKMLFIGIKCLCTELVYLIHIFWTIASKIYLLALAGTTATTTIVTIINENAELFLWIQVHLYKQRKQYAGDQTLWRFLETCSICSCFPLLRLDNGSSCVYRNAHNHALVCVCSFKFSMQLLESATDGSCCLRSSIQATSAFIHVSFNWFRAQLHSCMCMGVSVCVCIIRTCCMWRGCSCRSSQISYQHETFEFCYFSTFLRTYAFVSQETQLLTAYLPNTPCTHTHLLVGNLYMYIHICICICTYCISPTHTSCFPLSSHASY